MKDQDQTREDPAREERSVNGILVARIIATAIKFVRNDQKKKYGLKTRHVSHIYADGIGKFNFDNGQYRIESPTPNETILTAEPFDPDSGIWDGPSMTWDMTILGGKTPRKDGLFEASLNHDEIFHFAEEIAKANDCTVEEVYEWANRILQLEMKYYAQINIPAERSLIRRILDFAAGHYSKIKKIVRHFLPMIGALVVGALVAGCVGCWPEEEGTVVADPIDWTEGK